MVRALRNAAEAELGAKPPPTVSGPANESYIFNSYGIPTCVLGPVGGNAHAADEYVEIESIFRAARIYTRAAVIRGTPG